MSTFFPNSKRIYSYISQYMNTWSKNGITFIYLWHNLLRGNNSQFSRGVSLLFKIKIDIDIVDKHTSFDERTVVLFLKINEKWFTFIYVYSQNNEKTKYTNFKSCRNILLKMLGIWIICIFLLISIVILKKSVTKVGVN